MKVSLNVKFLKGPYGGGMQFSHSLKQFLLRQGITVINTINDDDIDIILHISPFPFQEICSYSYLEAFLYKLRHPDTIIVLRINECDERKATDYMNNLIIDASRYSDHLVFIASWLKPLLEKQGLEPSIPSDVILNGADQAIFNTTGKQLWKRDRKMRIVTHHFGGNYMKGHDIYQRLDTLLDSDPYKEKFEFTFIGNIPKDLKYKNTRIIDPLSGKDLAEELKTHDVYLTATRNEPAGMHHIEGALCGLPLLYINSGALPEYCNGFGIEFEPDTFELKLLEMYETYDKWFPKMASYPNSSEKMTAAFYNLFVRLHTTKMNNTKKNNLNLLSILWLKMKNLTLHSMRYKFAMKQLIRKMTGYEK